MRHAHCSSYHRYESLSSRNDEMPGCHTAAVRKVRQITTVAVLSGCRGEAEAARILAHTPNFPSGAVRRSWAKSLLDASRPV